MNEQHKQILNRINKYADEVMQDIDPQKVPVSAQLDRLKPVMEEIAAELEMQLEDVFILYMDLASEASAAREEKLQEHLKP